VVHFCLSLTPEAAPARKTAGVEPRGGRQKQPLLQRLPRSASDL